MHPLAIPTREFGPGGTDAVLAIVFVALVVMAIAMVVLYRHASGPHQRPH
jgi:hypothetical protein